MIIILYFKLCIYAMTMIMKYFSNKLAVICQWESGCLNILSDIIGLAKNNSILNCQKVL